MNSICKIGIAFVALHGVTFVFPLLAQETKSAQLRLDDSLPELRSALLLMSDSPRRSFPSSSEDPIHAQLIAGTLPQFAPRENQVAGEASALQWRPVSLAEGGSVSERGLYLYVPIDVKKAGVLILHAGGQSETYVNGIPRVGNVYGNAYAELPIAVSAATNHLLLRSAGRKSLQVKLSVPPAPIYLNSRDMTLPDLVVGSAVDTLGAVIIVNATDQPTAELKLVLRGEGLSAQATHVPSVPGLSIRKVGFRIVGSAPEVAGEMPVEIELRSAADRAYHHVSTTLRVVTAEQPRRVTFVSKIDDSVQFYALREALPGPGDPDPAILLTCHGAGVDARGQAAAYSTKSWFHIVAPTNRRPYGFDWEDFGRMDAMEVLQLAQTQLQHDRYRIYLSGHSMGGHGAWHLAVTYPDRFAAVGPSAGWISWSTYGRRREADSNDDATAAWLERASSPSDTLALVDNLKDLGVYILHGAEDDNVPVEQAQTMARALEAFHRDWTTHEEAGKKHWWSNALADGGSACLDWPMMLDLFARHAIPPVSSVRTVEFATANPGISSKSHWLSIDAQHRQFEISRVAVTMWPNKARFQATSENVARLTLDARHLRGLGPIEVEVDGQLLSELELAADQLIVLERDADSGSWSQATSPPAAHKGPHRYGGIKDELRNRMLLVVGTHGSEEENQAAANKARLDAETFWYRGNGSLPLIADSAFRPVDYPDRTILLYGNAETNSAWQSLLGDSPVQVRRGEIQIGERLLTGDDLSALFVRPRTDSNIASVIAVAASGSRGMRGTCLQPLFVPKVRYPDCLISRIEETGNVLPLAAGCFGNDWSLASGEFSYHE